MKQPLVLFFFIIFISTDCFSQVPVADFNSPAPEGCFPHTVIFMDASLGNPTSWTWDFGDPNAPGTSSLQNPTHIYAGTGIFPITLIVSNASGTDTIVKSTFVKIFRNPQAAYTVSQDTVCPNQPVTFTDASIPGDTIVNTYLWTFNDGSGTETTNPAIHSYINSGSGISSFVLTY